MTRLLALFIAALLVAGAVHARGGDGGDYSGGGSSDGSSSSGSDWGGSSGGSDWGGSSDSSDWGGDSHDGPPPPAWVVIVVFGTFLGVGVLVFWLFIVAVKHSVANRALYQTGRLRQSKPPASLKSIWATDRNFSPVLFKAFAHLVYVKYHESRGGIARAGADEFAVAPYLSPKLRKAVQGASIQILQVIVGGLRVDRVAIKPKGVHVWVRFKANIVRLSPSGKRVRYLIEERFRFSRRKGVLTRPPERVLSLGCPSCGSKQEPSVSGKCPSCGHISANGTMDWVVTIVTETAAPRVVSRSLKNSGSGVEPGTERPSVIDPAIKAAERELRARHPDFSWKVLKQRAEVIFRKLQEGWTKRDESILRPYELDTVFDSHRIWLERYREEGVRNVLDEVEIRYIQPVKIEIDAWFESITVRIRASMLDYKVDDSGRHLSGNRYRKHEFTEYFTLVRRTGLTNARYDPLKCPQCGAPLDKISQLGICGYCDTRITTGEFDWVLAQITQDEEYSG